MPLNEKAARKLRRKLDEAFARSPLLSLNELVDVLCSEPELEKQRKEITEWLRPLAEKCQRRMQEDADQSQAPARHVS